MLYKNIILTFLLILSVLPTALGQVTAQGDFKLSEEPKEKSDSVLVENVILKPCDQAVLIIGYRLGSGKKLKELIFNKKKYTPLFTDTLRKGGHIQGIVAIPLGKVKKTIKSDLILLLNDKAGVRGAVAQLYQNVNQQQPFTVAKKIIPDTTNTIDVTIPDGKKQHLIFDLLSGKSKKQRYINAQVGKEQKLLAKPQNIRPHPSKRSGLLLMASESSSNRKNVQLKWSLERKLINVLYQAVIIQADTESN